MAKKKASGEKQLISASYEGDRVTVSSLLEKGADPNFSDRDEGTALYSAVRAEAQGNR